MLPGIKNFHQSSTRQDAWTSQMNLLPFTLVLEIDDSERLRVKVPSVEFFRMRNMTIFCHPTLNFQFHFVWMLPMWTYKHSHEFYLLFPSRHEGFTQCFVLIACPKLTSVAMLKGFVHLLKSHYYSWPQACCFYQTHFNMRKTKKKEEIMLSRSKSQPCTIDVAKTDSDKPLNDAWR